jgi:hypothetical protein
MDRYKILLFLVVGAVAGAGMYLQMYGTTNPNSKDSSAYSIFSSKLDENGVEKEGKPFSWRKVVAKLQGEDEVARMTVLGEYFPTTPEGWVMEKASHAEIVRFAETLNKQFSLIDSQSMRQIGGMLNKDLHQPTVVYIRGEERMFVRIVHKHKDVGRSENYLRNNSWLLGGGDNVSMDKEKLPLKNFAGIPFETRYWEKAGLLSLRAELNPVTAIAVLTASPEKEVEALMRGMDFESLAKHGLDPEAADAAVKNLSTRVAESGDKLTTMKVETQSINDTAGEAVVVDAPNSGAVAEEKKSLLSSLLGGGQDGDSWFGKEKSNKKKGGSFKKIGNFASNCKSGAGAKTCRVGE